MNKEQAKEQTIEVSYENALKFYRDGIYPVAIQILNKLISKMPANIRIMALLLDAYLKANMTSSAANLLISVYGMLEQTPANSQEYQKLILFLQHQNIPKAALRIKIELENMLYSEHLSLKNIKIYHDGALIDQEDAWIVYSKIKENPDHFVFPMTWPLAFGDFIRIMQIIKGFKESGRAKVITLICPLNRPELKDLALNDYIDYVFDITSMPDEELTRGNTLTLFNQKKGVTNLAYQEFLTEKILEKILSKKEPANVIRLRYFPLLSGRYFLDRPIRIWETPAALWINDKYEFPKIYNFDGEKKNKITIHFREAGYGDACRNVNINKAQGLIDSIKKEYPAYEIMRLGDSSMTHLENCVNANESNLSVKDQMRHIAESKLFIGCHSAPQMLAVACSDTPIICINYTCQETTISLDDNVARMSYEPLGKQVKAIFYNIMYDKNENKLIPSQNNSAAFKIDAPENEVIMLAVIDVLGK